MACTKRPAAFYAFIVIALFTIGFNILGFASDRLVILNRKFTIEEIQLTTEKIIHQGFLMEEMDSSSEESSDGDSGQMIDEGGVIPPGTEEDEDEHRPEPHHPHPRPPHPRPHHGGHRRHHHHHHGVVAEFTQIQEWLKETVVEIEHVQITLRYGVWHSKLCMHAKMENMEDDADDDMNKHDDDDSSSSEEGHKKKCSCKKISTKCALAMSTMFLDMNEISDIEAEEKKPFYKFNPKYFIGNTCLTEHRVEITLGFGLLMLAVLIGIVAFKKKMNSCWATICLGCLLVASLMMIIPVGRILRYNMVEVRSKMTTSDMHFPHALLALLLSACGTLILAIIVAVAALRKRRSMEGKWSTLQNEAESFSEKKNGMPPSLVFIPEPLTGKSGLYDIWGDVKPVEYMEPEKKPLE